PKTLDNILAAVPSGVQERWFARLYLIKPLAIFALALFWIATGIVALGPGRAAATAHLAAAGFAPPFAEFLRVAGSIFDIVLGAMLLIRRLARPALITMLAATPLYLLVGTATAPQLWIDPLGPFLKIIPMLVAPLLTRAILEERCPTPRSHSNSCTCSVRPCCWDPGSASLSSCGWRIAAAIPPRSRTPRGWSSSLTRCSPRPP